MSKLLKNSLKFTKLSLFFISFSLISILFSLNFPKKLHSSYWLLDNDWNIEQYYKHKQILAEIEQYKRKSVLQEENSGRNYDVLHYNFNLDWYNILLSAKENPAERAWNGTLTITLQAKVDNFSTVELDCVGLEILGVTVNEKTVKTPQPIEQKLLIPLETPLNSGEKAVIEIAYQYSDKESQNIGFNFYYKGDNFNGITVEEPIAYTVNSPEYARFWFPCNDSPGDKATVEMNVTVPQGFTVASNGILDTIEKVSTEDGRNMATFRWSDSTPIATYLINVTASKYKEYSEKFKSPNRTDSIDILYYVWENDYENAKFNAKKMLQPTVKALEFFSNKFIDYPFCKYGTVEAFPFIYSAMENQTLTMINKSLLAQGNSATTNTVAHEIVHSWFGDLVTMKNWDNIWFKEGAAVWGESLFSGELYGENSYYSSIKNTADIYLNNAEIFTKPIYGNSSSVFFTVPYVYLTYQKASWIFHQLNVLLGEELNLSILRKLLTKYQLKNIDIYEFKDFYKEELKDNVSLDFDIDLFFEQWLFKAGHPLYDCYTVKSKENSDDETYTVKTVITQTQEGENVPEVFETPIYIVFLQGAKVIHSEKVVNNQRVQEFNFKNIPEFTNCRVDVQKTLCKVVSMKTDLVGINDKTAEQELILYPNPAVNQQFVYISKLNNKINTVKVLNYLGNELNVPTVELANEYQIDTKGLLNGVYFIKIGDKIEKLSVIR